MSDHLIKFVKRAYEAHGKPWYLTPSDYSDVRLAQKVIHDEEWPSSDEIQAHFGNWPTALKKAGVL